MLAPCGSRPMCIPQRRTWIDWSRPLANLRHPSRCSPKGLLQRLQGRVVVWRLPDDGHEFGVFDVSVGRDDHDCARKYAGHASVDHLDAVRLGKPPMPEVGKRGDLVDTFGATK